MKTAYLTLSDFFTVCKKNLLPIAAAALVAACLAGGVRAVLPEKYSAASEYYVRNMQGEAFLEQYGLTSSQLAGVQALAKEYADLVVENDALLDRTIEKHSLSLTREELREMLSATSENTVVRLTVTHTDAALVDAVAKAMEAEVPAWLNETAWPNLSFECVVLMKEAAPAARSSAHFLVWGALGAVGGALTAYLFFLLRFLFGDRLMDTDEMHRALPELPLLGEISDTSFPTLRTNLEARLRDVPHPMIGIVDVEGAPGLLAGALARTLAEAEKTVLIVDLKTPTGEEGAPRGLYSCLDGTADDVTALLQTCDVKGMKYLPAGETLSPASLLATDWLRALLADLAVSFDYVLIDFDAEAPAAVLADVLVGYVLVASPRQTGARALRAAHAALQNAGGRLLGLAVDGVTAAHR